MLRNPDPAQPAPTDSNLLYRMSTANRLLLWMPPILLGVAIVGAIFGIVFTRVLTWRIVDCFVLILSILMLVVSRRRMAPVVVKTELEGADLQFRKWNGTVMTVPRRGRSLRKLTNLSNQAWVVLEATSDKQQVRLMCQDKEAMSLLEDLERRGVVRGPGNPKDKYPGVPLAGGRR